MFQNVCVKSVRSRGCCAPGANRHLRVSSHGCRISYLLTGKSLTGKIAVTNVTGNLRTLVSTSSYPNASITVKLRQACGESSSLCIGTSKSSAAATSSDFYSLHKFYWMPVLPQDPVEAQISGKAPVCMGEIVSRLLLLPRLVVMVFGVFYIELSNTNTVTQRCILTCIFIRKDCCINSLSSKKFI